MMFGELNTGSWVADKNAEHRSPSSVQSDLGQPTQNISFLSGQVEEKFWVVSVGPQLRQRFGPSDVEIRLLPSTPCSIFYICLKTAPFDLAGVGVPLSCSLEAALKNPWMNEWISVEEGPVHCWSYCNLMDHVFTVPSKNLLNIIITTLLLYLIIGHRSMVLSNGKWMSCSRSPAQ